MRISDWSSDVCSSDLVARHTGRQRRWRTILSTGPPRFSVIQAASLPKSSDLSSIRATGFLFATLMVMDGSSFYLDVHKTTILVISSLCSPPTVPKSDSRVSLHRFAVHQSILQQHRKM